MKTITRSALLVLVLGLTAGALPAADQAVPAESRVKVIFAHPEKYTDVRDNNTDYDNELGRAHYLPLLKEHLEQVAGGLLAPGQSLTITFSDIDLAGDFEPWRGPQFSDVRIVKDIYIPRLTFAYRLTDESGRTVQEGERKLVDLAYQTRLTGGFRDDPLRYEKSMLSDWVHDTLPARKG